MKNINTNVNSNNETINKNNSNNGENNMNEINLKSSLYCAHCAKFGISCPSIAQPSNCSQFINISSDDVRKYIRSKVIDIMEQIGIEQDKIQAVAKMDIKCF